MKRRFELTCGPAFVEDDGVLARARGVPYGAAARFAPPKAFSWVEPRDLTERGPACPQLPSRLEFVTGPAVSGLAQSEDCHVLTVTAPADADGLPVMVWFHGGAYVSGSGESALYDADDLVREGRVIVVNVSYRLGIFGYCTPQGVDEANLGLLDQLLALQWVHDNIAAFGGDPARVTLFGQSAGGDSVFSLMLSEAADGLYSRAIIQSAPLDLRYGREAMTLAMRRAAAESLNGTSPFDATVEQLHAAQVAALTAARSFGLVSGLSYGPALGVDPLPAASDVASRLAKVARTVDLLVGCTGLDAAPFVEISPAAARLRRLGPFAGAGTRAASMALTRKVFDGPARRLAATWRKRGGSAASYRFDWAPSEAPLGACHCMELPFLFSASAWSAAPMLASGPIDEQLAREMRALWSRFTYDGVAGLGAETLRLGD